jgi:general secretion pathway protein I
MTVPVLRLRQRAPLRASGERRPSFDLGRAERGLRSGRGFTLLEVMVALAVLAAAFMALAELGGSALRNHAYARDLSAATLLARGKLAELEERYEDSGFKDSDESDEGSFAEEGRPDVRWKVELVRPDPQLGATELMGLLTGAEGGDPQALLGSLVGGQPAGGEGAPSAGASPLAAATAGIAGQMLQTQLTAFGEQLKKSLRELRLTVSWDDGRPRSFTVTEHLVVLNPRAPGGARGDSPDLPPNLGRAAVAAAVAGGAQQQQQPQQGGQQQQNPLLQGTQR